MGLVLRITAACAAATATFAGSWWLCARMLELDQETALTLAGFAASLVLFVAGYWAVRDRARPAGVELGRVADELAEAVRRQWADEEDRRRVHDPVALPLRWRRAPGHLVDHPANIGHAPVGAPVELADQAGRIEQVAEMYRRVPSGRLVVLGPAGSGKTVLAARLTLDLLAKRDPGGVVPAVVSVGSWDPATPLRQWLADRLARDYPGLAHGPTQGGPNLAISLVDADRILPILDGFDEIAAGLHSAALTALNAVARTPLVLTSRVDEYAAAVAATDVLTGAAVLQLDPLGVDDLVDYLPRTTRPDTGQTNGRWDPVVARLAANAAGADDPPAAVLREALSTPLMVFLARTVYSDTPSDNDPARLLDPTRHPSVDAVQRHLLAAFATAVYRRHLPKPSGRAWEPDRAQAWLAFLALHLRRLDTQDLGWWRLRDSVPRLTRALVGGLAAGLAVGLLLGLRLGLMGGLAVALVFGLNGGPTPSRTQLRFGRGGRVVGLVSALAVGLVAGLAVGPPFGLPVGLAAGLAFGLVGGRAVQLGAPIDVTTTVQVRNSLAIDRRTALFQGLAYGIAAGLLFGIMSAIMSGPASGLPVGLAVGLAYALLHELMMTAWGEWLVLVRFWLPVTGRVPWRVMGFLDDAHQRGVLRQVGAVYQFRHARLRDQLADSDQVTK